MTYTYDAANRLTSVMDGVSTSTYVYNGDGDRFSQTVDGVTTSYVLDVATPLTMVLAESEVETVQVHDLVPRRDKVVHELLLGVVTGVDFRQGPQLEFEPKIRSTRVAGPLEFARCAITALEHVSSSAVAFHTVLISSRFTKKSLVSVSGRLVKTPCSDWAKLAFKARIPPTSTVISGAVSVSSCARSTSSSSAGHADFVLR
jgi:YD repeat-containing protein